MSLPSSTKTQNRKNLSKLARACWNGCAGILPDGEACHIHFPNLRHQAVDMKVPAVCWRAKWWVVDYKTAARIRDEIKKRR